LASTEKLGTVGAFKVADLSDVTGIITDTDHPTARHLRAAGAVIVPAGNLESPTRM
jgi:DeoR/GlpR family transcriptional regulator of sugar metabolism